MSVSEYQLTLNNQTSLIKKEYFSAPFTVQTRDLSINITCLSLNLARESIEAERKA